MWIGIVLAVIVAVLAIIVAVLPPLTRSATDRWGATDDEVAATLPGDGAIPDADAQATKAITIDAPPSLVYALIAQQGMERAGWHGWDWFYDATGSSDFWDGRYSRRVVPELQDIGVGDRVKINDMVAYRVVQADRPRAFVLLTANDAKGEVDPTDPPAAWSGNTMQWVLTPLDGGERTRLILRQRAASVGQPAFVDWLYDKPLDMGGAVMGRKTMVGIKRLAEKLAAAGVSVDSQGVPSTK